MINKKNIKEFDSNGFTIVRNFLKKKEINNVFSQLNYVLDIILKYNKIRYDKKISIEDKYFLLKKKKPILKSHFYDSIRILDSFNNIVFSKKIIGSIKKLLKTNVIFVTNYRLRTDHKLESANLALHQELNNISSDVILKSFYLKKTFKKNILKK